MSDPAKTEKEMSVDRPTDRSASQSRGFDFYIATLYRHCNLKSNFLIENNLFLSVTRVVSRSEYLMCLLLK